MIEFIRTTLHPEGYHGRDRRPPYFEGWYYKLVDASERHRYAVIPGVSLSEGGEHGPHAFVQVLDGVRGRTAYHVYPLEAFCAGTEPFELRVGPNTFTATGVDLALPPGPPRLRGRLRFTDGVRWPVTLLSPGIMGWYAWVPFMETYHGVVSLDHAIHGALEVDGEGVDFTQGRGYIEKDWGKSFPSAWIWTQTNHFDEAGTSLTASVAMIPWAGRAFRGFIVGLWWEGVLYRFATYTGAVTDHLGLDAERVTWHLRDSLYRLELVARRTEAGELRGPSKVTMDRRVPETLRSTVEVRLLRRDDGRVLFAGAGRNAGLEVVGDLETLLKP